MEHLKEILDFETKIAVMLLESGAEISRIEETLQHISKALHVDQLEMFIIANGIFLNLVKDDHEEHTRIQYVPQTTANMTRICQINGLSRDLEAGKLTFEEAVAALSDIEHFCFPWKHLSFLSSGLGAGAFCFLFGGSLADCAGSFLCGLVLWGLIKLLKSQTKVLKLILAAGAVTGCCILLCRAGLIRTLHFAVMGSVVPLIPGVQFLNGVKDITDGDLISGGIRLVDATADIICIAAGVGLMMSLFY